MEYSEKIGIIGTAVPSLFHAPYDDPTWKFWTCVGASAVVKRVDLGWEVHMPDSLDNDLKGEYLDKMKALGDKALLFFEHPRLPDATVYDWERLAQKHCTEFLDCTVSWMLAEAIERRPKVIGLWGVHMAHHEEYAKERKGVLHFLELAKFAGIEVQISAESPLLVHMPPYPFIGNGPRSKWARARSAEVSAKKKSMEASRKHMEYELAKADGYLEAIDAMNLLFPE